MSLPSPSRRALVATAAALVACLRPAKSLPADPVFAAIETCREAERAFLALVADLGVEPTPEAERRADEAGAVVDAANKALGDMRPTTVAGLHALIRFYADDAERNEAGTVSTWALGRLKAAIDGGPL